MQFAPTPVTQPISHKRWFYLIAIFLNYQLFIEWVVDGSVRNYEWSEHQIKYNPKQPCIGNVHYNLFLLDNVLLDLDIVKGFYGTNRNWTPPLRIPFYYFIYIY